jgi:hypothetical protein
VQARNRLLDSGYTAAQIRTFIGAEIQDHQAAISQPLNALSRFPFVLPPRVRADVNQLAHIWVGDQLGPIEGLAFLTDFRHAMKIAKGERYGKQQSMNASKPRGTKSEKRKCLILYGAPGRN